MVAPRGEELLKADGWHFVEVVNDYQVWEKGEVLLRYYPSSDTFGRAWNKFTDKEVKNP